MTDRTNDALMQVCCRLAIYRSFLLKWHPRIKSAGADVQDGAWCCMAQIAAGLFSFCASSLTKRGFFGNLIAFLRQF